MEVAGETEGEKEGEQCKGKYCSPDLECDDEEISNRRPAARRESNDDEDDAAARKERFDEAVFTLATIVAVLGIYGCLVYALSSPPAANVSDYAQV
ncbi:hypothetical protein TSAR_015006 [Trichomalopsis sarcophagae]|uniref:Uncharacterized protein n=1 Tax=Trichomalopsis sarcophagae TaxID=543379 RepID=A0A232EW02_9HYME|nr:hypothetical protein TSAR_015006 [Trichomalopsis sarcophagae]